MKKGIVALLTAVLLASVGTARAATEIFNLGFSGDIAAMTSDSDPTVPTEVATDTWTKSHVGWTEADLSGESVGAIYIFNGNVRGISIALSSGLTDGVEYTLSANAKVNYGGGNQRVTLAVTQVDVGTGDYLMDNFYNGDEEAYQPVVPNGDAVATNVLQETLALNSTWQTVSGSFVYNAALGSHVVVQLQGYDTGSVSGGLHIDDFILQDPREATSLLMLDPADELAMSFDTADAVVTNEIAASYQVGLSATNVTITAVSVVGQTHPGSFVNATALPLTLNSPAPVSEAVSIGFDNSTAGLTVGQVATGIVEIVWNDLSSASSSTSTVPVSATYLAVNPANTIAVWYGENVNANLSLQGLQASRSGGLAPYGGQRSTDGTYGTLSGAPTGGSAWNVSNSDTDLYYAITNNTGSPVTFDSLHFDIARQYAKGPDAVIVSISGDVTDNPSLTNHIGFTEFPGAPGDYDDFDVDLTGLADRTLAQDEAALITFSFYNGDLSNPNAVSTIDNIALLGSGLNGAVLSTVDGGAVQMPVTGLDLGASELVEMYYTEGDAETNVTVNSVTVSGETHPGAFSYTGSFPIELTVPGEANDIFTVLFDNTVANLAAGETANAVLEIAWNEIGLGERIFELPVSAVRPAAVPTNTVIALFDTAFVMPDAAVNGVLGVISGGDGIDSAVGSDDGTYGSLAAFAAPVGPPAYKVMSHTNTVLTLTVTNQAVVNIDLSSINFDVGRIWVKSSEAFTLSVAGDLSNDPALLVASNLTAILGNVGDADDFDIDLTGLADHTLGPGESAAFIFTFVAKPETPFFGTYVDNIALIGTIDLFGGWAANEGLDGSNNALGDNPDGDGMDNLMEYATDSDPLNPDSAATTWDAEDNGINWFYHVYSERTDDGSLTFTLGARDNLVFLPDWSGVDLEWVGESAESAGFKSVTNRTDLGSTEFIRLQVEQN